MLRDYEILYIVRPELEEADLAAAVASVNQLVETLGGTAGKTDVWGRRRLAYEVRHLREGHYVLQDFTLEPDRVPEMESTLKISETVFRHLIVRKPELKAKPQKAAPKGTPEAAAETPEATLEATATPEAEAPLSEVQEAAETAETEAETAETEAEAATPEEEKET